MPRSERSEGNAPSPSNSAVDALRRETERLTTLGETLARVEDQWTEKFLWLETRREQTVRSRRRLAAQLRRLRRLERSRAAESASPSPTSSQSPASPAGEVPEAVQAELDLLRGQLAEAAGMLEAVRDARMVAEEEHRGEVQSLRAEIGRHEQTARELLEQLAALEEAAAYSGDSESLRDDTDSLRQQLERERIRCEELESQNASLATQLANSQVDGQLAKADSFQSLESLTWEQRKAAILRQLHQEDQGGMIDEGERESLREMVAKADREIQRRDAEIAELQQLLEHQSTAVGDSVAVGAAAIAQMIDADDLVREEREKLQAIKAEWQEKLRQAEIDLSLERAKLARERRELEQKRTELEDRLAQAAEMQSESSATDQPRRRRWLTQLGLSEGD